MTIPLAKTRNFFLVALVFVVSSQLVSCGLFYEDIELRGVKSAHVKKVNSKFVELDLMVHISNPNNFSVKITDSQLEAFADTIRIGDAKIMKVIEIPPNSENDYHCPIHANFDAQFANNLGKFVRLALNGPVEIDVKGDITGKAMFVTKTIQIDIREKFEF